MNDQPDVDNEELKLPPKFISVHPLAAKKGSHYTCVICSSDGAFLCKLCRSCYCCREHLLLDDLACHAILCERQAAILEIKSLPLATRARAETSNRLHSLEDECRRVAYLESRRHVLEGHHELALPAAERSLFYAREVHGQNSIDLVPPLLALADVATLAGAKEAIGYVSRAAFLIQEKYAHLRKQILAPLKRKISDNLRNLAKINESAIERYIVLEQQRKDASKSQIWASPSKPEATQNGTDVQQTTQVDNNMLNSNSPERSIEMNSKNRKSNTQVACELSLDNAIRDEIYAGADGTNLAYLTSKYWSSNTKIQVWEEEYESALKSASIALYYATQSCGIDSLQTALCIYQLAHLGQVSEKFTEAQQIDSFAQAQRIFKNCLLQYYSALVLQLKQLAADRKIIYDYSTANEKFRTIVADYNKAEYMREEDRLSFRADIKEAIQRAVFSLQSFEKKYGQSSTEYCECVVLIGIALQCTEDSSAQDWDQQGAKCCALLSQTTENVDHRILIVEIYKILYAWQQQQHQ